MEIVRTQETKKDLSDKETAVLLFNSYKFSQGGAATQKRFLYFAVQFYGVQTIDKDRMASISDLFIDMFTSEVDDGTNRQNLKIGDKGLHDEIRIKVRSDLPQFIKILSGVYVHMPDDYMSIEKMALGFINRDIYYLNPNGLGRPGKNKTDNKPNENKYTDKRYSYFYDYAYLQKLKKEPFWGYLFGEVKKIISEESFLSSQLQIDERVANKVMITGKKAKELLVQYFNLFHSEIQMNL